MFTVTFPFCCFSFFLLFSYWNFCPLYFCLCFVSLQKIHFYCHKSSCFFVILFFFNQNSILFTNSCNSKQYICKVKTQRTKPHSTHPQKCAVSARWLCFLVFCLVNLAYRQKVPSGCLLSALLHTHLFLLVESKTKHK